MNEQARAVPVNKKARTLCYTASDKAFLGLIWALLVLFLVVLVYPLLYVVIASFSGGSNGLSVWLIPRSLTLEGYKAMFNYSKIWIGYRNSAFYMVAGTAIALVVTVCCAYPLSRRDFRGRKLMMGLCVFTMYFQGSIIPTYLWIRQLGMMDTIWVIILPGSLVVYNMIIMRTYFQTSIPEEIHDAAIIDGSGDLRFLLRIVLPLSGPIIAVIGLYYAVMLWNSYFFAMVFLHDQQKWPLTLFLRQILIQHQVTQGLETSLSAELESRMAQRAELMKYCLIIVSCLPMLILYPFVQKFFVKGVMIGAIKG